MGHARIQLRPERGRQFPHLQRPLLARQIPYRRPAGRCGGLHALPRLFEEAGRMGPEPVRRQRKPGGGRLHQALQRDRPRPPPRRAHHRGGIDRLACRLPPDLPGGSRLQHEVEHGVDERHTPILSPTTPSSASTITTTLPLRSFTRSPRISSSSSPMTRSSTASARSSTRCPATSGRSSPTCGCSSPTCSRSPGRSSLYGGRDRPVVGMERKRQPRLAPPANTSRTKSSRRSCGI